MDVEPPDKDLSGIDVFHRPPREDRVNWLTHGFGFVLSLIGSAILLPRAAQQSMPVFVICIVYTLTLTGLYLSSTLSHKIKQNKWRFIFRQLDQAFIYLLITGSLSPYTVKFLPETYWLSIIGLMWLVSIVGFVSKMFFAHRVDSVSVWVYLALGWTPVYSGMLFTASFPSAACWAVASGGIIYSAATWFLFNDRRRWYFHAIWHILVITASVIHYLGILWLVCGD